uniref:Uncharacterized protein n=1 Tax=Brassica campestris TaxID=3711 RepID=M4DZN9_BRACM
MGVVMARVEKVNIPHMYIKLLMVFDRVRKFHLGLHYDFLLSLIEKTRKKDIADDGIDMGVSSSGDQTGIRSRLSRRARMLIRSSKTTQSPSVDETSGKDCEDRVINIVYKEIFKDVQTTQVHEDT